MFSDLPDPRAPNAHHRLSDLLMIALCASLCGAQGASDYAQFARSKRALLEMLLGPFDPPSHDTFSRVFRRLDPEAFAAAFADFARGFAGALEGVVAIDGKAMRRAYEVGGRAWPPVVVSAWAAQARLVLGALTAGRAGEGEAETAIRLIGMLDLSGATVTGDALHCHRRMAAAITARGGAYALALKGNQSGLKREAETLLAAQDPVATDTVSEVSHGRSERRTGRVVSAAGMGARHRFEGLAAIAEITCERGGAAIVFCEGYIEAPVQGILDAPMGPDGGDRLGGGEMPGEQVEASLRSRARTDHAPANIALLTRLAMTLLQKIDDPGTSLRRKIKRCAWEDDYLINAIAHMR